MYFARVVETIGALKVEIGSLNELGINGLYNAKTPVILSVFVQSEKDVNILIGGKSPSASEYFDIVGLKTALGVNQYELDDVIRTAVDLYSEGKYKAEILVLEGSYEGAILDARAAEAGTWQTYVPLKSPIPPGSQKGYYDATVTVDLDDAGVTSSIEPFNKADVLMKGYPGFSLSSYGSYYDYPAGYSSYYYGGDYSSYYYYDYYYQKINFAIDTFSFGVSIPTTTYQARAVIIFNIPKPEIRKKPVYYPGSSIYSYSSLTY